MPIRFLTSVDSLNAGDNIAIGSALHGDDRRVAISILQSYLQSNLTILDALAFADYLTQYAVPSATGQTIAVNDTNDNTHLIITPTAGFAAMTITLPSSINAADKQALLFNCTEAITTLTIDGNGASVVGEPTTLAANAYFRLKYDSNGTTWYRVG